MEKDRIQDKIRAERHKLSAQMQLKKADRNQLFIDSIKGRISDLQAQINPDKTEEKKAVGEKSRRQEEEFQAWRQNFRAKYLAFVKTVDENQDPKTGFGFPIENTLEIDTIFDLMRKHIDPKYNISAPRGVINYYQHKVHKHEKHRTVQQVKRDADRLPVVTEPVPGTEPDQLHRGDQEVSGHPDGERELPPAERGGGEGGYIPDL